MQGVKALGIAVLGGELQNVDNVILLVSLDIAGDDDALAVSQTLRLPGSRPCPQSQQRTGTGR